LSSINIGKKNEGIFLYFFVTSADRVKRYQDILLAAIYRPSALTFVAWFMQKLLYKKSVPQKRVVAPNNGYLTFKPPFWGHQFDSLRVFLNVMNPIFLPVSLWT
jgi:uncharacterized protein YsxB (DUF464 family)